MHEPRCMQLCESFCQGNGDAALLARRHRTLDVDDLLQVKSVDEFGRQPRRGCGGVEVHQLGCPGSLDPEARLHLTLETGAEFAVRCQFVTNNFQRQLSEWSV